MRVLLLLPLFWPTVASAGDLMEVPVSSGAGQRVTLQGDTAVVANVGGGAVFVYDGATWTQQDVLSYSGTPGGRALDGDTVLIGLPTDDTQDTDAGAALVFTRSGATWSLDQELFASDAAAFDNFGISVAFEGDKAFVGALGQGGTGAVYGFEQVGGVWSEVGKLVADSPLTANQGYGSSLSMDGDTLLVDSYFGDAYVFVEDAGLWEQEAQLPSAAFVLEGGEASLSGDTAVVSRAYSGAFVFRRSGVAWDLEVRLEGGPNRLGKSCAIEGDVLALGNATGPLSPFDTAMDVLVRSQGTWSRLAGITETRGTGVSVAVRDGRVLMGMEGIAANVVTLFELPTFVAPTIGYRNAGTNPDSYTVAPGYVGGSLDFTVDLSATGHDMALVIGFDSPFGLTLGGGQTLLCFDVLGSGGELINTGFHPGPIAEISLAVPNDLAFAGFSVCTQAVHAFGVVPFALSNAQDIVIGACF